MNMASEHYQCKNTVALLYTLLQVSHEGNNTGDEYTVDNLTI